MAKKDSGENLKEPVPSKEAGVEAEKPLWREILEVFVSLAVVLIVLRLLLGALMPVPLVAVVSCSMLHEDDVIGSVSYGIANAVGPLLLDSKCVYDAGNEWQEWIKERNPSADTGSYPLRSGFSVGDMILVITPDGKGTIFPFFSETKLGDVVIYQRDKRISGNDPIIHRVVGIVRVVNGTPASIDGTADCFTLKDFEDKFAQYVKNCQAGLSCPYTDYPKTGDYNFYITKGDNNRASDQCSGILPITDNQILARGWIRVPYVGWLKMILNRVLGLLFGISLLVMH